MEIKKVLEEILNYGSNWVVKKFEKHAETLEIHVYIEYVNSKAIIKEGAEELCFEIYDLAPMRRWQHLNMFEYTTYIYCRIPRFKERRLNQKETIKTMPIPWAEPYVSYTRLFALFVIQILQSVKEQKTTATICKTSETIVRSIMDKVVEDALEKRGYETELSHISLDEKSFGKGHQYASILIDAKQNKVVECVEGRSLANTNLLYYLSTGEAVNENIEIVSMDMWNGFISATEESAPNSLICFDKFHVFKHLSTAIDKTRKYEVQKHPQKELLKGAKYTMLKNAENRTTKQQEQFEKIDYENFKTAQVWKARENFKFVWESTDKKTLIYRLNKWFDNSYRIGNVYLNKVAQLIYKHIQGIANAILLKVNNASHEQCNANIQRLIIKARGFKNFNRFRINLLFYYGKLKLVPLNL